MKRTRGSGSVYLHGAVYWCKYYLNGKPIRENTHCNQEANAKKFLRRRLGQIAVGRYAGPQVEKVTVNELAADIRNDYKVNGRASSDDLKHGVEPVQRPAWKAVSFTTSGAPQSETWFALEFLNGWR